MGAVPGAVAPGWHGARRWRSESGMDFKRRRRGIFVVNAGQIISKLREERYLPECAAPTGLEVIFGVWCYKYGAPTVLLIFGW